MNLFSLYTRTKTRAKMTSPAIMNLVNRSTAPRRLNAFPQRTHNWASVWFSSLHFWQRLDGIGLSIARLNLVGKAVLMLFALGNLPIFAADLMPHRTFSVLQVESYQLVGKTIVFVPKTNYFHPPIPTNFVIHASVPCELLRSVPDVAHFVDFGFCPGTLTISNTLEARVHFRGQAMCFLTWSNSPSPGPMDYIISEWTSHSPQGFREFHMGDTNQGWVPFMDVDPCNFACSCRDSLGNLSQFTNFTTNRAQVPVLAINVISTSTTN